MTNPTEQDTTKTEVILYAWNGTTFREVQLNSDTRSLVTMDTVNNDIHKGDHFYVSGYSALALNERVTFYFETPPSAHLDLRFRFDATQSTTFTVYEGATGMTVGTGGVTATIFNSHRGSTNTSSSYIIINPTGLTTTGTLIFSYNIGANQRSGFYDQGENLILEENSKYVFDFLSNANTNILGYFGHWIEHIDYGETGATW